MKPRDREFYTEFRSVSAADELALGFKTADSLNNDTTTDMIGNTMLRLMGGGSNTLKIYYNSSLVYTG
ncbi:hypothetical protein, partial [Salmonella enterica]|uniref:hypothetical protein n=1 Tax=Salmonella enterica TaxID=28901 RepID=UPI0020A239A8